MSDKGRTKLVPRKGHGNMEPPSVLAAASRMDFDALVEAVQASADAALETDRHYKQNALHILVIAGSVRTRDMMDFLLTNSRVSTHGRDVFGRDPLDLAIELDDKDAVALIAPHWFAESQRRQNVQHIPDVSIVKSDPEP